MDELVVVYDELYDRLTKLSTVRVFIFYTRTYVWTAETERYDRSMQLDKRQDKTGLKGTLTLDLFETDAVLYQVSYQAS